MYGAIDALKGLTNVSDEMAVPMVLSVANFACQAHVNFKWGKWEPLPISLNFIVLAPSGAMKSSIFGYLMSGIKQYQLERQEDCKVPLQKYKIDMKLYEKEMNEIIKNDGQGVLPVEPDKPNGSRYLVEKPTINGIFNTLDKVPFAGLFTADAADFLNSYAMSDPARARATVTAFSRMYSGEVVSNTTGSEEASKYLPNRRFSMLLMTQPSLAQILDVGEYKKQGFTHRLIITNAPYTPKPRMTGTKEEELQGDIHVGTLSVFNDRIYTLLSQIDKKQQTMRDWYLRSPEGKKVHRSEQELVLPDIMPNDAAKKILIQQFNMLADKQDQAANDKNDDMCSFYGRSFEQLIRIASTLACFEGLDHINEKNVECAIGLFNFFTNTRQDIDIPEASTSPIIARSNKFFEWLLKRTDCTCSVSESFGAPGMSNRTADEREAILVQLAHEGKIETWSEESSGKKPKGFIKAIKMESNVIPMTKKL